jgi:DNA-binding NarL/FixJ family response regulator
MRGQPVQAARLAGSATAMLEELVTTGVQPGDQRQYQAIIASIRASLSDAAFEQEWSAGRALPLDEVLADVLGSFKVERGGIPAPARSALAADLSPRELEVLRLIAAGKSNKEIAEALVISLNTVFRHVSHIFQKTGAANRAEAAAYAVRHDLTASS